MEHGLAPLSHRPLLFVRDSELGEGQFGRVFLTTYKGKTVAIKITMRLDEFGPHSLPSQRNQLEELNKANVKVAKPIVAKQTHLIMDWIDGRTIRETLQDMTSPADRLAEMKNMVELIDLYNRAGLVPDDIALLPDNVIKSKENGSYYTVDPGGMKRKSLLRNISTPLLALFDAEEKVILWSLHFESLSKRDLSAAQQSFHDLFIRDPLTHESVSAKISLQLLVLLAKKDETPLQKTKLRSLVRSFSEKCIQMPVAR